ncbi:MAG: hypothetical protein JW745_08805, partial [Sedimentisphaerales bacterium]|nr:hypothetical protein [Sedimentisphaerales bacterium]
NLSGASGLENCFWDSDTYPLSSPYNPLDVHFTFDETSGTVVENTGSLSTFDATAMNSPVWSTAGVFGGCLTFDGVNDYLVMTDYKSIPGSNSRTVSVWVKTTSTTAGTISCWGDRVNGKLWQLMMDADGKYRIAVYGGTEKSSIAINDGQWHHIAVVLPYIENADISDCQLYLDGELDSNTTVSATMAIDTASEMDVTIGTSLSNGSYVSYFNGSMDDYRIYSVPLSEDDIVLLAAMQEPILDYCLTGLPTEQMQDINTYLNAGWNIVPADEATADSLWVIAENEYPKFTWSQPRNDTVFFDIESLKGLTEVNAIATLAAAGITATVKYDCSRLVAAGLVISSESPCRVLRNATELTIVVSTGIYDWSTNPGAGTIDNPYQISTPGMLFGMKNDQFYYFKLMNDLDLSNYTFSNGCVVHSDILSNMQFRGSFDGNGHVVRNATISGYNAYSMTIEYSSGTKYFAGFFPVVTGSETVVKNLGLENIKITTNSSNTIYAGAFVGACDSPKIIYNCFVTGMIDGGDTRFYNRYLGGFAGYGVNIDRCFADVDICNVVDRASGGFAALGSNITNSFASGSVEASYASYVVPGGFIGSVINSGSVQNCYSTTKVTSPFVSVNGFIGKDNNGIMGSVLNCFWDCQASGIGTAGTVSNGATAKSTAQMQDINTYINAGWGIVLQETSDIADNDIWFMPSDGGYPRLIWELDTILVDYRDLLGLSESNALALLAESGINAVVGYDYNLAYPAGAVFMVQGGLNFQPGETAILQISLGSYNWSNNPGVGTAENPWQLSSAGMINAMTDTMYAGHFMVTADIDFAGYTYERCVIGKNGTTAKQFTGVLDGRGHVISNVSISSTTTSAVNGFISINKGNVKNLTIDSARVLIKSPGNTVANIGCLVGLNDTGTITSCDVRRSSITITDYAGSSIGGLCGGNSLGTISDCSAQAVIDAPDCGDIGGLIGYNNNAAVAGSYAEADIRTSGYSYSIGGFCGQSYGTSSIINCYAKGNIVSGYGGFIFCQNYVDGVNRIDNCYSTVSVSASNPRAFNQSTNSFWDVEVTGLFNIGDIIGGATGLSTAQMQDINTFIDAGWDFTAADGNPAIWRMAADGYPFLAWERDTDLDNSGRVDLCDFAIIAHNWQMSGSSDNFSDLDKSGTVDLADLAVFVADWLN